MRTALLCLLLVGCATNSGVVPAGGDTFVIAKQAATGFPGLGTLKTDVLTEANQHCTTKGKAMQVVNSTETQPPYILGNYPRAEVTFRCV